MIAIVLGAAVSLVAAPASSSPKKIAVVALGNDPVAAGELQRTLEAALQKAGVTVKPTNEFVSQIPATNAVTPTNPAIEATKQAIADANKAYFENDIAGATKNLGVAGTNVEAMADIPASIRLRYYVTSLAVHLRTDNKPLAQDAARQAISLTGPSRPTELDDFPSAVGDFYDATKATMPTPVNFAIATIPAGAAVTLDGAERTPGAPIQTYAGKHVVSVRAGGYRTVTRFVDTAESPLVIGLALQLPSGFDPLTEVAVNPNDRRNLELLAQKAAVEGLVVARNLENGRLRGALWLVSSPDRLVAPGEPSVTLPGLVELVSRSVPSAGSAVAVATPPRATATPKPPRAIATPRSGDSAPSGSGVALQVDAGLAWDSFGRNLADVYNYNLTGVGPRVVVRADAGSFAGRLEASFIDYVSPVSTKTFPAGNGPKDGLSGGSFLRAGLGGGYRLGPVQDGTSVTFLAGGEFASYMSPGDPHYGATSDVKVFSGWSRTAIFLEALGRFPVGDKLSLSAGLGVAPVIGWAEASKGTSGTFKSAGVSPRVRAGALFKPGEKLSFGAEILFEQRSVQFDGQPSIGYPGLADGRALNELELQATGTIRYLF